MKIQLLLGAILMISGLNATAQDETETKGTDGFSMILKEERPAPTIRKAYFSTGFEGGIFSLYFNDGANSSAFRKVLRYSAFFHVSGQVHYNFNENAGIFGGLGIKNIGFIEKYRAVDSTVKRRVYALSIPIGLKFGNMTKDRFFLVGGGIDLPFNYKEKGFVKRNDKDKFNEWFSERTPRVLPYVFVGYNHNSGFYTRATYYPTNFLNTDFEENNIKPYKDYNVNLVALTVGYNIRLRPKYN